MGEIHQRWWLLLLLVWETVVAVEGFANPSQFPSRVVNYSWNEEGVVSLTPLLLPTRSCSELDSRQQHRLTFVAGTKRGRLYQFEWDCKTNKFVHNKEIEDLQSTNLTTASPAITPHPIYSLLSYNNARSKTRHLFCGGGDRFITIWEEIKVGWSVVQKLGPHTGWVKALAMDDSNLKGNNKLLLHSIGCNCIETWEPIIVDGTPQKQEQSIRWQHRKKRSIESSPEQGSTLSSDLLCLATWRGFLFSGGVDGRIHVWLSDPELAASSKPQESIAAHGGRVNVLSAVPITGNGNCLLVSSGHDGALQFRRFSGTSIDNNNNETPHSFEIQLAGTIQVHDEQGRPVRVTAMACSTKPKKNNEMQVVLGTSSGILFEFILATANDWDTCEIIEHRNLKVNNNDATDENCPVYDVLVPAAPNQSLSFSKVAVVGHSNGLLTVAL